MTDKRLIAALDLPDLNPGTPPTEKPELTWINPCELLVDASYQRDVGERGLRLIRQIVRNFDWRKFKPPTCVWSNDGLETIDGQHSAIAAASHPSIDLIPVVIVDAAEVADRAGAFVGLNRDRLNITQMQLHAAGVVAGDETAGAIERVCQAAGVTVLRMPASNGKYKPRETVAVRAIGDLIKRVGEQLAIIVVRVLAEADLAPITATAFKAAEAFLMNEEYADQVAPEDLTQAIIALGAEADKEAGVFAATHCVPRWRGLVAVWFKKAKRRRPRNVGEGYADRHTPSDLVDVTVSEAAETVKPSEIPRQRAKRPKKSETDTAPPAQDAAARRSARHHQPFRDGTYP